MGKFINKKGYTGPSATDKKGGIARFATSAEAEGGESDDTFVSPLILNTSVDDLMPDASVSVKGKIEISSDAEAQGKSETDLALVPSNLAAEGFLQWVDVSLTNSEIKALAASPKELVPAQGAGSIIKLEGAQLKLNAGSEALTESTDNMQIKYVDDSGAAASQVIESTGFIDQTVDTYTTAQPKVDAIVAASAGENAALVLDNIGSEFAGNASNDATMNVRVYYMVHSI